MCLDIFSDFPDTIIRRDEMVADAGIRMVNGRSQALQRGDVSSVMAFVLGPRSRDKVVECLHLGSHVFHLGIDDADRLFMDRLGGGLDRGVVLVDGLPVIFHLALQGIP